VVHSRTLRVLRCGATFLISRAKGVMDPVNNFPQLKVDGQDKDAQP